MSPNKKTVIISGASGFVGKALCAHLSANGFDVKRLVRNSPNGPDEIFWDPRGWKIDNEKLEGVFGVIHLAGENIAGGRWSEGRRNEIRDSRVVGTQLISKALANTVLKPDVFITASAIGYYGNRGEEKLNESSIIGTGFLPLVCAEWEGATERAKVAGIRVVHTRIGLVLGKEGGMLKRMLPIFRARLGGKLGQGNQFMSWITLEDLVSSIHHILNTRAISGAVNLVGPSPVTNEEFTNELGKALKVPTFIVVPAFVLRLILGDMADELLLASTRVYPEVLLKSGFKFKSESIQDALKSVAKVT